CLPWSRRAKSPEVTEGGGARRGSERPNASDVAAVAQQRDARGRRYPSRIASASIVMSTSSLTTNPPRSRTPFQFTPKSLRFIRVVARKPARVLGPLSTPSSHQGVFHSPRKRTSSVAGRVTPRIVSSPPNLPSLAPTRSTPLPRNVIVG